MTELEFAKLLEKHKVLLTFSTERNRTINLNGRSVYEYDYFQLSLVCCWDRGAHSAIQKARAFNKYLKCLKEAGFGNSLVDKITTEGGEVLWTKT